MFPCFVLCFTSCVVLDIVLCFRVLCCILHLVLCYVLCFALVSCFALMGHRTFRIAGWGIVNENDYVLDWPKIYGTI